MSISSLPPTDLSEAELDSLSPSALLTLAASLGRTDLLVSALRSGAPVNAKLSSPSDPSIHYTALQTAILHNRVDCARALLAAGASIDDTSSRTTTSLLTSANSPSLTAVFATHLCQKAATADLPFLDAALRAGLDPSAVDSPDTANTPLHWAASFGQPASISLLLAAGAPHSPVNGADATPLIDAARAGHLSAVKALVQAGADPSFAPNASRSAIDLAPNDEILAALHPNDPETLEISPSASTLPSAPPTPYFLPGEAARSAPFAHMDAPDWTRLLWPAPQRVRLAKRPALFTVPPVVTISASQAAMPVAQRFVQWTSALLSDGDVRLVGGGAGGLAESIGFSAAIFLRIDGVVTERATQAYNLSVRDFGIDVVGSDEHGLFYACARLFRILQLCEVGREHGAPLTVPILSVSDWPSVRRRALYLDVSGNRLPTLGTLRDVVSFMSTKMYMNQLQLYVGDNFESMDDKKGSALRHEDILELGSFCREHFVELVPVVGEYLSEGVSVDEQLGSNVDGTESKREARKKKKIIEQEKFFDEFLPLFDSPQVHIGELTKKDSWDFLDIEHMRDMSKLLRFRQKQTLLVFGDKIAPLLSEEASASGILAELPAHSILILEANSANSFTFQQHCLHIRQHGLIVYTCASSFLGESIAGRVSSSLKCARVVVEAALMEGAAGVVLKDSSLKTHGAPLVLLYQSMIPFAGAAWNETNMIQESSGRDEILSHLYDTYIFNDPVDKGMLGSIAVVLGDLHLVSNDQSGFGLFSLLTQRNTDGVGIESMAYLGLRRALKRAEKIENALASYRGNANDIDVLELRICAILLSAGGRIGASLLSASSAASMDGELSEERSLDVSTLADERRSDICNVLLEAIDLMRDSWMQRYADTGFAESVEFLMGNTLSKLAAGMPYAQYLEDRKAEGWMHVEEQ